MNGRHFIARFESSSLAVVFLVCWLHTNPGGCRRSHCQGCNHEDGQLDLCEKHGRSL